MIHDKMINIKNYVPTNKWQVVKEFISKISIDMEETIYEIDNEDVYARIMSYNTKLEDECIVEAHDCYVDIQFTLVGEEGISIYPREELEFVSFDEKNDFNVFKNRDESIRLKVRNKPGWFTLLHTNEAHRPQESVDGMCSVVKKGVIKIKESCYE